MRVKLTMDQQATTQVSQEAGRRATRRLAEVAVRRTRSNITRSGRVRTGRMRGSVGMRATGDGYAVGSDLDYFRYQEQGTRGHTMPPGKVMVFTGKGGALVFTRSVKGVKAGHFLRDALRSLSDRDLT